MTDLKNAFYNPFVLRFPPGVLSSHAVVIMRRFILILSFLLCSFTAAAADNQTELQRLYSALNMLNQEQQATHQQFQMVQEMLRSNSKTLCAGQSNLMPSRGEVPNYDDVIAAQKSVIHREEGLYQQADQLFSKYGQLEEQKKPLQERIYNLTISK
ncbi:MAG: hypothetical protein WC208_12550 [Gallionella sp.]|jgi:septal ring factor EnvC (AmiA/AmiB activator)